MLELFRKNHFAFSLLMLPYAFFLRFLVMFDNNQMPLRAKGWLSEWCFSIFDQQNTVTQLLAILLLFFQAALLNRIIIKNRVTYELTLLPGVFLILVCSLFPTYTGLSSPLIANTFVLFALDSLYSSHKKSNSAGRLFNTGFWLSISALCYFGNTHLFFFGVIGLSSLRTLRSREWLQYITGYLTPVSIIVMLDFLLHGSLVRTRTHFSANLDFFSFIPDWSFFTSVEFGVFGVIILLALISFNRFMLRKNIHAQKKLELMYWLLFFGSLVFLFQHHVSHEEWLTAAIPFAVFLAVLILGIQRNVVAELVHFVLVVLILGLQIVHILY